MDAEEVGPRLMGEATPRPLVLVALITVLAFAAPAWAQTCPGTRTIADEATPTPDSQDPNYPITEVPQKPRPNPIPVSQRPLYDSADQVAADEGFQREMEARLKLLGLKPLGYGAIWDQDKNRVVIHVEVDHVITPELTDTFERFTHGAAGNIPVELVQGHPIHTLPLILKATAPH
jgi:hypothetical protein